MSLPDRGPEPGFAGFVLAGGQSSRMGTDKALTELAGEPLVARALRILRRAGLQAFIAGSRTSLTQFAPVLGDLPAHAGLGPLAGICAALKAGTTQLAVFLPVDLPLLPSALIDYLLAHSRLTGAPITVPTVNGYAQTFPAVIDWACLPSLLHNLESGNRGCFGAFQASAKALDQAVAVLPLEFLIQSGQLSHAAGLPPALWFMNINTPRDRGRAEAVLSSRSGKLIS